MKTIKSSIIIGLAILLWIDIGLCQVKTAAQAISEAKELIQSGSNSASADKFKQARNILSPFTSAGDHQALVEYYLGYIDYQMAVAVNQMDKEKAPACLDSAVEHLKMSIEKDDSLAEAHALLSSCYGIQISFSPMSGIWRGPKSASEMSQAKDLAPENPRVVLLGAIGTYNTPALFGGGKEKGFEGLKRAAKLFDQWKTTDSLQPDWGREQVYAWIGMAYLDRNETILARKAFEKALEINADYGWVKYVLMKRVSSDADPKKE
jgi:tetratricopeptide (TPR) repeat protein